MPPLQVLRGLESSLHGLAETEAEDRLAHYGDNVVLRERPAGWPARVRRAAGNPFVLILLVLDVVCLATGNLSGVGVITAMAVISCALQISQEYRADRAAAALRAMGSTTATVVRQASPGAPPVAREVPTDQLVPGDVIRLAAGDLVPADVRLLRSADLLVSQALLTGESLPAAKQATLAAGTAAPRNWPARGPAPRQLTVAGNPAEVAGGEPALADSPRLCLLGSTVVGGTGTGVVVATGPATYFGATNQDLPRRQAETAFDRGVRDTSRTLIYFILVAVPAVLAIDGLVRGYWLPAFLLAISVAVGLTPEMLPVVVNTTLARGAELMRLRGVIVKRLPAIHNLGAMDVLCTDKTGTLTQDRLVLAYHLDPDGRPDAEVLHWAARNAHFGAEHAGQPASDPMDEALLGRAEELGLAVEDGYLGLDALAFDAVRRRASVALRPAGQLGAGLLVTKGAVEEVVDRCSRVRLAGVDRPLDDERRAQLAELADSLHVQGVRVLAVAVKARPPTARRLRPADEAGLTLVGYLGLVDEAKTGTATALAELAGHGVRVAVVTGDHPLVAARVCADAGLPPGRPVTGRELDALSAGQLSELVGRTTVFARVDPRQKARVVTALRAAGHTVGYLGDGVNDAPALRAADVAICVDTAVDIARESSDMLLARKDLATLTGALVATRRSFANIIKYLKITVSSNVGNVCSVLAASVLLPFLPMLPLQILVQNLLFDVSQIGLAFDRDDEPHSRPRGFNSADLTRFIAWFGAINTLADLATFAVLWHTLGPHTSVSTQLLFHTGWFVENLLTQALAVHLLRGRGGLTNWSWAARPVLATTVGIAVASLAVPFTPLGGVLGLYRLPAAYYGWLGAVLAAFCVAMLAAKSIYQRAYRTWL